MFKIVYYLVLICLYPFYWYRFEGRENIPAGPCVLCGNHSTNSDAVFMVLANGKKGDYGFMAKEELFRVPVLRHIIRWLHAFPVKRGMAGGDMHAIRTGFSILKSGKKLLMFPEGTRVKNGVSVRTGKPVEPKVFQYQIAYNVIPQIGGEAFEGYTSEEMKMQNEGRKIMHLPELKVSCTCVRVPVVRSHSVSIVVRTKEKISVERARELIAAAPGCKLVDDLANKRYPMPLETSDQDLVFVGRIRDDLTSDNGLNIWCCGDQVRKGAATNAVQIAQLLIAE